MVFFWTSDCEPGVYRPSEAPLRRILIQLGSGCSIKLNCMWWSSVHDNNFHLGFISPSNVSGRFGEGGVLGFVGI